MSEEKPLNVQVAEALGFVACDQWRLYEWDGEPSAYCPLRRGSSGLVAHLSGPENPEHRCFPWWRIRGWGHEANEKHAAGRNGEPRNSWDLVGFLYPDDMSSEVRRYFGPPHYERDWSATGPLIADLHIGLIHDTERGMSERGMWMAFWYGPASEGFYLTAEPGVIDGHADYAVWACDALVAVCHLILALAKAGKLPKVEP